MPRRLLPRWPDWVALVYVVVIVVSGFVGLLLGAPSHAMTEALGASVLVYSGGLVFGGALLGWSVARKRRRSEMVAFILIAALTVMHALVILLDSGAAGFQTSMRLLAAAVGMLSWAGTRWQRGISRGEIERHLNRLGGRR